ncbi:MAG TPA: RNA polymerase sigma factor [Terracidiphilus sp.]
MSAAAATLPFTATSDRLSQLFAEHHRRVLLAAYRITGSMADAEDVAQTVFLRLGHGESLEPKPDMKNAASYLYRAAINGALDLLRRRKTAAAEPIEAAAAIASAAPGDSPEAEISSRQLAQLLRRAISELSPRAAEMFTLRYVEELGNREIAALMGTSQAVVAVTLHQSRSRLKKRLTELERGNR